MKVQGGIRADVSPTQCPACYRDEPVIATHASSKASCTQNNFGEHLGNYSSRSCLELHLSSSSTCSDCQTTATPLTNGSTDDTSE